MFNSLATEIIAGIIIMLGTLLWSKMIKRMKFNKFKTFFAINGEQRNLKIVYGNYEPEKNSKGEVKSFVKKRELDGKLNEFKIDIWEIISEAELISIKYIIQETASINKDGIDLVRDSIAYKDTTNSHVVLGGPIANSLTEYLLRERKNIFFDFKILKNEDWPVGGPARIIDKTGQKKLIIKGSPNHDTGIILKIQNPNFKSKFDFICAGCTDHGTKAAAWYLMNNWKKLFKKFKEQEFGIVIRSSYGNDTSGFPLISSTKAKIEKENDFEYEP